MESTTLKTDQDHIEDISLYLDDNRTNKFPITCRYCSSIVLRSKVAKYQQKQVKLPKMQQKSELCKRLSECAAGGGEVSGGEVSGGEASAELAMDMDELEHFFRVEDMMTFENVAFAHTLPSGIKYLACADCEMGPIGFSKPSQPSFGFFTAANRVKMEPCQ